MENTAHHSWRTSPRIILAVVHHAQPGAHPAAIVIIVVVLAVALGGLLLRWRR